MKATYGPSITEQHMMHPHLHQRKMGALFFDMDRIPKRGELDCHCGAKVKYEIVDQKTDSINYS